VLERIHHNRYVLSILSKEITNLKSFLSECLTPSDYKLTKISENYYNSTLQAKNAQCLKKFEKLQPPSTNNCNELKTVVNISNNFLDNDTLSVLEKGLNFALAL
jgi:hypothetical protein